MKKHFGCPIQATTNVMSGKWKVQIIWRLAIRSCRFAELRRLLVGVSEKVLAEQLRELEHDGIIERVVTPLVPPRVDYLLTEGGRELIPIMDHMCSWGTKHLGVVPTILERPKL